MLNRLKFFNPFLFDRLLLLPLRLDSFQFITLLLQFLKIFDGKVRWLELFGIEGN
jgi:hypothetical protein